MPKLPPAEKLPLAVRKDIRDEWEAKKPDLEKQLSDVLGETWTVDINPNAIYPYGEDNSYAKNSTGSCIYAYVDGAIDRIKYFLSTYGDADGAAEINDICHAHVLTMDLDEAKAFSYCGCDVSEDGKLRILFREGNLGTNISYALDQEVLLKALNEAKPKEEGPEKKKPLSLRARLSVRQDYDAKIEELRAKAATVLGKPDLKFTPGFDELFARLRAEQGRKGSDLRDDWERNLGSFAYLYFEGLLSQLEYQKFGEDELLAEGFHEAVDKGEVALRIVDKLSYDSYGEVVIEGGVLYIQSKPTTWGTNISYAASKLMDQL